MPATTSYQAGTEANATQLSYAVESVYGVVPATTFQAIRYVSESLSDTKTRARPSEINNTREVSAAVTTQESAAGGINYALSYGTFDDFISVALGSDWQVAQAIAGVAGDIALTNTSATSATLISTAAGKFTNIAQGQWIRLLGFTNAANNGFYRVTTKVSALSLTLASIVPTVTETPAGTAAQVRAQTIANGTQFKSLYIQQKLSPSLWLNYPGSYVSGITLTGGIGQFLNGAINVLASQEKPATVDASTGGILPAPNGKVFDPINGFVGAFWNETALGATVDSFSISMANTGAAIEFGMGSSIGAGILAGTFEVTGSVKLYFKDFVIYSRFKAETAGSFEIIAKDSAGSAYVITAPNALLVNPQINAGGPGQPVWVTFALEGNPQSAGGTIQIDKLPAV
jgi:hypothetical protein